jgi:hypothetical protein
MSRELAENARVHRFVYMIDSDNTVKLAKGVASVLTNAQIMETSNPSVLRVEAVSFASFAISQLLDEEERFVHHAFRFHSKHQGARKYDWHPD